MMKNLGKYKQRKYRRSIKTQLNEKYYVRLGTSINHLLHQVHSELELRSYTGKFKLGCCLPQKQLQNPTPTLKQIIKLLRFLWTIKQFELMVHNIQTSLIVLVSSVEAVSNNSRKPVLFSQTLTDILKVSSCFFMNSTQFTSVDCKLHDKTPEIGDKTNANKIIILLNMKPWLVNTSASTRSHTHVSYSV